MQGNTDDQGATMTGEIPEEKTTRRGPGVIHAGNPTGRPQRSSGRSRRKHMRRAENITHEN
jgi:hypothetical protein